MSHPKILGIGHVSIFVNDLDRQVAFYRDVVGLQTSDEDRNLGIVFMSAQPDVAHHHLVLLRGRNTGEGTRWLQHVGFRCERLEDVIALHQRLVAAQTPIDMTIQHGNALAVYFADPEGNLLEGYWQTGLKARQPFGLRADFNQSPEEILKQIEESVRMYGETGVLDESALSSTAKSAVSI